MRRHDARHVRKARPDTALAAAIRRNEWELAALLLLNAVAEIARAMPPGTIDDVLALISDREASDDAAR